MRALGELDLHFAALYARRGRPSIPPEHLVRGLLLMILHSIRGERQLMEQIRYNLAYRWFVGLTMDDKVWDATVFTKNRERLMQGEVAERFFEAVLAQARERELLSEEHFTVDGTLIRAWASRDSFHAKDEPPSGRAAGMAEKFCCGTRMSRRRMPRRGCTRRPWRGRVASYLGHVVTENRNGLVVAVCATQSSTTAEREACRDVGSDAAGSARSRWEPTSSIRSLGSSRPCASGAWSRMWPSTRVGGICVRTA